MQPRFRHAICLLALALALLFVTERNAHASLFACFQALAPLEQGAKAAEIAAKAGSCSAQATSDPVMAMTIAGLTAAAVGGAFSTTAQCKAKINGAVGKIVASALLTLPFLPSDAKNLLTDFVNGTTPLTFQEIVAAFPVLNAVMAYIDCGCAVAGAPGEYSKIAKEYSQNVKSCANFASDAVGTILDGAGSLGEDIHEALHGPSMKPGVQQEQECWVKTLPDEIWTATPIYTKSNFQCNVLRCKSGHVVVKKISGGKTVNKCASACPDPIKTFQPGGLCYSTVDSKPVEGVCTQIPGVVHCCGDGQKVFQWGVCSPACSDGIQYWDVKAGKCTNCPSGWGPTYQKTNSSVGTCVECPSGQTYEFSTKKCEPLKCSPPQSYFDPARPHSCATCAPGQVYAAERGRCECGEGTIFKGAGCVCPKNANKLTLAATFTCSCPPGSILDPVKSECVCPAGKQMLLTSIQGSLIASCLSRTDSIVTTLGPTRLKCDPPSYFDPTRPSSCATCGTGQMYASERGRCECGEGTFFRGAGCVCPKNANKQTSDTTFSCSCPPGSTLDPVESACVCTAGQLMMLTSIQGSMVASCVSRGDPVLTTEPSKPEKICRPDTVLKNGDCRPAKSTGASTKNRAAPPPTESPPDLAPLLQILPRLLPAPEVSRPPVGQPPPSPERRQIPR
jgi:hypothetical protein